ncbi:BspA family leucine-rich repeat surface protein, partial [Anaerotruncus sp. X29]|nr:BspA family leucine-rich repeat surface protein [Anaerotruncus sp. X29]
MWMGIVIALAMGVFTIAQPQINTLANSTFGQISSITNGIGKSDNISPSNPNKINPDDAKWVEKGDWGSNGKFVVDKDGNAVIYAIDTSKPIVFHTMADENAKLPDTLTTLTFQDKVQGDTNSSMDRAFTDTLDHTFTNLKTINNLDTNVDTSNVTNMRLMFYKSKLTTVGDLSKWNTSKVTYMDSMFENSKLTSVGDLSQWNTSKVTNMGYMFTDSKLTSVGDLS